MPKKLDLKSFKKIRAQYQKGKTVAYLCRQHQISRTLFYRYLEKLNSKKLHKLETDERLHLVRRITYQGHRPSVVARQAGISRTLLYRWKKRYEAVADGEKLYALNPRKPVRNYISRRISADLEKKVLDLVAEYPELSTHKLANLVRGNLALGHHGVQNILKRHNLGLFEQRLEFAQRTVLLSPKTAKQPNFGWSPNLAILRWLIAPFAAIPKFSFNHPLIAAVLVGIGVFTLLYDLPPQQRFGYLFAMLALTCGFLFFAYSMKYYVTLALILGYSQKKRNPESTDNIGRKGLLGKIVNLEIINKHNSLEPDLSTIKITRKPFVSIHIPLYNERRVAERILTALTNLDWPNYEIVVADDSNDQTKEIVELFAKSNKRIKVSRRDTRSGYKGAALAKALEITDKKAEFVLVFDADFIPFPDTVEQFMKYFTHLAGGDINQVDRLNIAAVQGYQWHVLNKSENWVTRGIRTEYAGNYVIERTGAELYGGMKQIAGSVFCIRRDLLERFGWHTSITEDFNLTLRLYEAGYKIAYTPYIQTPSECVSTVKRLIRQRMRWAEGHSFNVARMFRQIMSSEKVSGKEKFEFLYLSPYYLQAAFFLLGTLGWFISELIFRVELPFWTSMLGWSLVLSNFVSLPLTNTAGLFLEESDEKDYVGIGSFVLLSYILVPFQAYASVKGFIEKEEGPWFRTPKTGRITDSFTKGKLYGWFGNLFPWRKAKSSSAFSLKLPDLGISANQSFLGYHHKPKRIGLAARGVLAVLVLITIFINYLAFFTPATKAASSTPKITQEINIIDQEYATASSTYSPTDNSLGLIKWDSTKFDQVSSVSLEVVAKVSSGSCAGVASLFSESGTEIGGVGFGGTAYNLAISGNLLSSLNNGTNYTVRIKWALSSCTVTINSARLIVVQAHSTILTKTQTQVEVGGLSSNAASTYTDISAFKLWRYDSAKYAPTPTAYFEASLKGPPITKLEQQIEIENTTSQASAAGKLGKVCVNTSEYTSGTYYFEVVATNSSGSNETVSFSKGGGDGGANCGSGTANTNTTVTVGANTSTPTRFRSGAIGSFPTGEVFISSTGANISVYSARVIILQSSASTLTNTMSQVEVWHDQKTVGTSNSWTIDAIGCTSSWYYDSAEYNPTPTAYFEATLKAASGQTAYMRLYDATTGAAVSGSEVSTTSTSLTRVRSGAITLTSAHNYYVEYRTSSAGAGQFVNAKVILDQNSAIYRTEMYHSYMNFTEASGFVTTTTYASINRENYFDPANVTGTKQHYYEAQFGTIQEDAYSQLYKKTDAAALSGSEVIQDVDTDPGGCTPQNRKRSGDLTMPTAQNLDAQWKVATNGIEVIGPSWLIIQTCSCAYAELYNATDGASVSGSEVLVDTTNWTLVRSNSITLTTAKDYKVRMKSPGGTGTSANGKVILDQNSSGGVSALETYQMQTNVHTQTNSASYVTNKGYFNSFDDADFSGTTSYFFEGTIFGQTKTGPARVATAYAILRNVTDGENVTASTTSEITEVGGPVSRIRSGQLTLGSSAGNLKNGKNYETHFKCTSTPNNCVSDETVGAVDSSWLVVQISSIPVPELAWLVAPLIIFFPFIVKRLKFRAGKKDPVVTTEVINAT